MINKTKPTKKIVLARTVLRNLTGSALSSVNGGILVPCTYNCSYKKCY
jgi:hypothetical protein